MLPTPTQTDFTFDADKHEYYLVRRRLESVTEVLGGVGIIDTTYFTERSRQRGKAVHIGCALLDQGRLDWDSVKRSEDALEEPIVNRVRAWARFKRETGFTPRLIEHQLYHPVYLYAGTLDRTGDFAATPKEDSLIDLKTGKVAKWTGQQTGGYGEMLPLPAGKTHRRRYGLELREDGEPVLQHFDDLDDGRDFLACLSTYRLGVRYGVYKRPGRD